jgi:IS30 family transposase
VQRPGLSDEEKAAIWRLVKQGRNWQAIGRELGRHPGIVNAYAQRCGGIAPRVRSRAPGQLSLGEREEISRGLAVGLSLRQIAAGLDRAPSTISREVNRHGGREQYRALPAERSAWDNATRPKACKLVASAQLRAIVETKLAENWSPQQIAR